VAGFGSAPARGPVTPATGDPGYAATSRRLRSVGRTAATNRRSSAELVAAYLYAQLDELRARESAARIDSPETENRMRVSSRRLRSSLATFGPLFTGSQAQHLRDELLWLVAVLGPLRDVEVMRDHLHGTAAILAVDGDLSDAPAALDSELARRHSHVRDGLC
jgi:CHAD domain-containing protein